MQRLGCPPPQCQPSPWAGWAVGGRSSSSPDGLVGGRNSSSWWGATATPPRMGWWGAATAPPGGGPQQHLPGWAGGGLFLPFAHDVVLPEPSSNSSSNPTMEEMQQLLG